MNISIKNPPERLVERLKARAASHNRTPEDEARAILEEALEKEAFAPIGPQGVAAEIRKLGLKTPSESTQIIRESRDR